MSEAGLYGGPLICVEDMILFLLFSRANLRFQWSHPIEFVL
jgi:hypothetical protein